MAITLQIARGARIEPRAVELPAGSTVRDALRAIGQPPEGCAVLDGERPVPLDEPVVAPARLTVVPTFSGG